MSVLNTRDRRTLAIGFAACAAIALAGRGVPHWQQWRTAARDRLSISTAALAHAEAVLASRREVAQATVVWKSAIIAADTLVIDATTPAEGAAELATIVSEIADAANIRLGTLQMRADTTTRAGLSRATLRLSAVGDITGLTTMLEDIESGAPLLVVRALTVSQSEPMSRDDMPEQLRFEVVVEGITRMRAPARPRTGGRQ